MEGRWQQRLIPGQEGGSEGVREGGSEGGCRQQEVSARACLHNMFTSGLLTVYAACCACYSQYIFTSLLYFSHTVTLH